MNQRTDVAVAGAGVAGLAAALALRRLPSRPTVTVSDPGLREEPRAPTLRAVALAPDAQRLLARLGAWDGLAGDAQPIAAMHITDTRVGAVPAPTYLSFGEPASGGAPLAFMVLLDALQAALAAACRREGVALDEHGVAGLRRQGGVAVLDRGAAPTLQARLVVAADGGRSPLRAAAGIGTVGRDYGQSAVVATLRHTVGHEGRATQLFLPPGPLALLPMRAPDGRDTRTSIVWTERRAEAERLAALPPDAFLAALAIRTGPVLGAVTLEDRPLAFPLRVSLARRLVAPRLALVGDAAHVVHPLAGQGLNLGLRDVAALAAVAGEALGLGLDPGADAVLAAYQRARRPDAVAMAAAMHGLNRLFATDQPLFRAARDIGLGLVDRAPGLKRLLMHRAAG